MDILGLFILRPCWFLFSSGYILQRILVTSIECERRRDPQFLCLVIFYLNCAWSMVGVLHGECMLACENRRTMLHHELQYPFWRWFWCRFLSLSFWIVMSHERFQFCFATFLSIEKAALVLYIKMHCASRLRCLVSFIGWSRRDWRKRPVVNLRSYLGLTRAGNLKIRGLLRSRKLLDSWRLWKSR